MSKFKKKAAKLFKIDLEKTIEEQLKDYLKDPDISFFEDPWDSVTSGANKSDQSSVSLIPNGDAFYDSLMELYISDLEYLTQDAKPRRYHAISGSGPAWFFEPDTRTLVKTERGMQVIILVDDEDDLGRLLVQTMNTLIMVPKEEILDIGYN
tara:strand:- start:80 stop:535 length:456 start_codon:yes stop_codon:yes gene_type:complete